MLLGSSKNGILEVTKFSVPTTSGTVSVIRIGVMRNMSGLTKPGSLSTCSIFEGRRMWYTEPSSLGLGAKDSGILELKAC